MKKSFRLFKVFNLPIEVNLSWLVIFLLIVFTLAVDYYPSRLPHNNWLVYLILGILSALLLFTCLVLHELSHALVARKYSIPVSSITLFIFGGVAKLEKEPESPRAELLMAGAGPLTSLAIAFTLFIFYQLSMNYFFSAPMVAMISYLFYLNLVIALFNLIPGFPLDGGRILRSIMWQISGDQLKATHIASAIGKGFAFLLIGWGIINFFTGALLAGIWLVVIGFFLEEAAMSGYQQLLIRKVLMGEKVSSFVSTNIQLIPADIDLELAVNQYFLPLRHFIFPVQAQGRIAGVVRLTEVKDIDRPTWPYTSISNVMIPLSEAYVVSPELDALHALNLMAQNQLGFLLVMDHDKFVGLVTHADLSRFYEIKNSLVRA